jgi:predicted AlkP superfamily pyrophosphatase or phosphodiesterase
MKYRIALMLFTAHFLSFAKAPTLAIVILVDQFAHHELKKLAPFMQGGIKQLLTEGLVYHNTYVPLSMPITGPSTTTDSTGVLPNSHGIVGNDWFDVSGKKVQCDSDTAENAAVFSPQGFYDYGKSSRHIMVDSISDQIVLSSQPDNQHFAYAISLKSRAAICSATKVGKAIWFDEAAGVFTSSKAYFDQLPDWLSRFNKKHKIGPNASFNWRLALPANKQAYNFKNVDNYTYARGKPLVGKRIQLGAKNNNKKFYSLFSKLPQSNKLLFDLACSCIDNTISTKKNSQLLLWICLSSLDYVGHDYGPDSKEVIDTLYHLDQQTKNFIKQVYKKVDKQDVLFILTGDHGIESIPELLAQEGFTRAQRINTNTLIDKANKFLQERFGINHMVQGFAHLQLYFDKKHLTALNKQEQEAIIKEVKEFVLKQEGVKDAWTIGELKARCYEKHEIKSWFKSQIYPGRSGQVALQPLPYSIFDDNLKGTNHATPYEPNTHVPLIIYQKGSFEHKSIHTKVWSAQIANTLAHILGVPKPSASTFDILPGIIPTKKCCKLLLTKSSLIS